MKKMTDVINLPWSSVASFAVKTANPRNLRRKDACGSGKRIDKLFF